MQAVILAAGEGVRMQPLTLTTQKSMIEVNGKPLLAYILESLPAAVDEIIIVVRYKAETVRAYFGSEFQGKKIIYVDNQRRGTGGALFDVRPFLRLGTGEKFLLVYGDDLHDQASIEKCLAHDRCLLVHPVVNPERFGIIVTDPAGKILNIEEKPKVPKSDLAAVGVYVFDQHIFDYEPSQQPNGEYYVTEMIEKMIKDWPVSTVVSKVWIPVGYPEDLKKVEEFVRANAL